MFCNQCGKELQDSVNFCSKCGKNLIKDGSNTSDKYKNYLRRPKNKSIVIALVAIIIIGGIYGLVSNLSSPEKAVQQLFTAIENQDVDSLVNLMPDEIVMDALKWYSSMEEFKNDFDDQVNWLARSIEDELGRNWSRKIQIKTIDQTNSRATVSVTINNETNNLLVIKEDGKWKILDFPF